MVRRKRSVTPRKCVAKRRSFISALSSKRALGKQKTVRKKIITSNKRGSGTRREWTNGTTDGGVAKLRTALMLRLSGKSYRKIEEITGKNSETGVGVPYTVVRKYWLNVSIGKSMKIVKMQM